MEQKAYLTLKAYGEDAFVERKSRFIGQAAPVSTEDEALDFIASVREKHRDARHHVFAYRLRSGQTRCSDDGEPQGTGGVPALEVLERAGIVDGCVVITRYFGGVLLGTGGLSRAYGHGAKLGVEAAGLATMVPCRTLRLGCGYELYGKLSYLLPSWPAKQLASDFGEAVMVELLCRLDAEEEICRAFTELTSGQGTLERLGESFADENEVRAG